MTEGITVFKSFWFNNLLNLSTFIDNYFCMISKVIHIKQLLSYSKFRVNTEFVNFNE